MKSTHTERTSNLSGRDPNQLPGLANRTVVGLFSQLDSARMALEALMAERGIDQGNISFIANDSEERFSRYLKRSGDPSLRDVDENAGIMNKLKSLVSLRNVEKIPGIGRVIVSGPLEQRLSASDGGSRYDLIKTMGHFGIPSHEAGLYAEGVRRGGALILIEVGSQLVDRAVAILDRFHPVDLEHTSSTWRKSGWSDFDHGRKPLGLTELEQERPLLHTATSERIATGTAPSRHNVERTERIPVVEEHVAIGKREVMGGGVRIRAFPVERPVQETVTLREEHVHIERRPVDRVLSPEEANRVFKEQSIEMTERHEEAVIGKQQRVVEEIEVSKDVDVHRQTVNATERHTEIQVERLSGNSGASFAQLEPEFRRHYDTTFGTKSGLSWDGGMRDAYRLGYESRYDGDWNTIESSLRNDWSTRHGNYGPWDRFRDAVRHGWQRARAKV